MNVNNVSSSTQTYAASSYQKSSSATQEKNAGSKNSGKESGVVYEKSKVDKEQVVSMLKADAEKRATDLRNLVEGMMKEQGAKIGNADSMWKFLSGGNFTVTAEAKAQAQEAISDDGYWGVKQTSDRIVDFAKALSGGDPEKADKMFAAFEKGFKEATKTWGKQLPQISQDTYSAVKEKFDAWKNGED